MKYRHDDSSDIIRDFWYDYFSFYYRDSDYDPALYQVAGKYNDRQKDKWGYGPRPEAAKLSQGTDYTNYNPLRAIRIYSMSRQKFSEYVLINPVISSFRHGEHTMEGSNLMEHEMTIQYEAVKYLKGTVTKAEFGDNMLLLYDNNFSSLNVNGTIAAALGTIGSAAQAFTDMAQQNTLVQIAALNKNSTPTTPQQQALNQAVNNGQLSIFNSQKITNPASPITVNSRVDTLSAAGPIQATGGVPTSASAGAPILVSSQTVQGVTTQTFIPAQANTLDVRQVTSDSGSVLTQNASLATPIVSFPPIGVDTATAADTTTRNPAEGYSIDQLTAALATKLGITLNQAQLLISGASQGSPKV